MYNYKKIITIFIFLISFQSQAKDNNMDNAYQFSFVSIDGKEINLSDFKDKVILIVNTASQCGFTPQYAGLQNLYQKYKDKGLVIIGVPSSDFANQEFDNNEDIKKFTNKEFNITFPLATVTKVKGKDAHPFYKWASKQSGILGSPKWNFHKYIIDKEGNFATWFASTTKPEANKIVKKIDSLL